MTIDLYAVTVSLFGWNGLNVNTFHVKQDVDAATDMAAVFTALSGFYGALETYMPSDTTVQITNALNLSTDPVTFVPFDGGALAVPTGGGRDDARLCVCIGWKTTVASKSGRGRTFVGPLAESSVDSTSGLLAPALVTAVDSAAFDLISGLATAGPRLQVYSRKHNARYEITTEKVGATPRTLRSRTLR